jgi:hypothetical protein
LTRFLHANLQPLRWKTLWDFTTDSFWQGHPLG